MDYYLSDDIRAIREICAEISARHIKPIREELDRENRFPHEIMKVLAESDLFRIYIPVEYEGLGLGSLALCVAAEELSKSCAGVATTYAANALGAMPILLCGSRGAEEEVPARHRLRREPRRLRPHRARRRLRRRRASRPRAVPRRRPLRAQRHQAVDHQRRRGRDLHGHRHDRPGPGRPRRLAPSSSRRARPASPSARRRTRWASAPRRPASWSSRTAASRRRT